MLLQYGCNKSKLFCLFFSRDAVHNKLVLEEEVMDLRSRQVAFEKREQRLAQLEASHRHLESLLEDWHQLARDHCLGILPEKAMVGPQLLRMRIETLQKKELLLTADKGRLDCRSVGRLAVVLVIDRIFSDLAELQSSCSKELGGETTVNIYSKTFIINL